MVRRVVVTVVALLAVLAVGGAALAAGGAQPLPPATPTPPSAPIPAEAAPAEAAGADLDGVGDPEDGAGGGAREGADEAGDPEDGAGGFGARRSAQARAHGACRREHGAEAGEEACAHLRPGPAHLHPAHPGRRGDGDGGDTPPGTDEGDEDLDGAGAGFGAQRAAGARAFGACMREHAGERDVCRHLRPGPARDDPAHPGGGRGTR